MERTKLTFFFIGCTLGIVLFTLASTALKSFNPDNAALGLFTSGIPGTYKGLLVSDTVQPAGLKPAWTKFKQEKNKVVLILGASQLHSINHLKDTDRLAVMAMNEEAEHKKLNLRFLQLSRPNGNFHDILAQYLTFKDLVGTPDAVLVSVTYDDLREPKIQEKAYLGLLPLSPDLLNNGGGGVEHLNAAMNAIQTTPVATATGIHEDGTLSKLPHEAIEDIIVTNMEDLFPSFKLRSKISAYLEWKGQDLASRVTRCTSYRRSPNIPEQHKAWNLAALDSIFKVTKIHGTKLLFYKAPHPQGLPVFYHDRGDYDRFHNELGQRCKSEKIPYTDLETIVPLQYWGQANGGLPDTFHFKGEGHEFLGRELLKFTQEHAHAF